MYDAMQSFHLFYRKTNNLKIMIFFELMARVT